MSDAETADRYRFFLPITTRWMDNDVYGHINNVTYYSYFDTVANHYLIHEGGLDIHTGEVIGLVVESKCAYRAPLAYPDRLRAGLRVDRLGNRSVTYGIAIFKEGEEQAAAHGHFVHVFVDRRTRRAVAMPDRLRDALAALAVTPREQA
ncbi:MULTISPECIES: thioesterase family protein [Corallococcus]|uniref:acyl-CoA thioesterase n=1 Tax=Corallococcus TaxID=83461 RepID=UPI00156049EC|nr:thioesterase family protein [Corallococcus sp. AB038B]NRD43077.1 acyl-CoA thioesterase [Corallococcus exiguus]